MSVYEWAGIIVVVAGHGLGIAKALIVMGMKLEKLSTELQSTNAKLQRFMDVDHGNMASDVARMEYRLDKAQERLAALEAKGA